jgi:spermidine synthase
MEAIYPGSDLDVIEIDPGVTQTAYQYLGLRPDTTVVSYNEDARMFLERAPVGAGSSRPYDLVIGDAFNDYSVPYHLTTIEFDERVRAWLEPDGIYMVNIIDGPGGSFLRAYAHTLRQAFAYVYVAPTISSWQTSPRSTFVLLASDTALDTAALAATDGGDGERLLAGQLLPQAELDALLATGRTVTLTDQYAPVDQMLAAVFRDEVPR